MFRLPLIFSAALMSFAHGANDVANAIGPLGAIVEATGTVHAATVTILDWLRHEFGIEKPG